MNQVLDIVIDAPSEVSPADCQPILGYDNWFENCLLSLGFSADNLPLGDFLQAYHNLSMGSWVAVSPIFWQASHNDVMVLAAGSQLNLDEDEAKLIFDLTSKFFQEEGLILHYHDAYTWFFKVDKQPKLCSPSPSSLIHKSLMPILESLDETLYWQKLFTEIQMLFSGAKIKDANGLWFYGAEPLLFPKDYLIYSDDSKLRAAFPKSIFDLNAFDPSLSSKSKFFLKDPTKINVINADNLRRYRVRWFWTNAAYITKPQSWWQRIRRKIC